ncbi:MULTISPECIES: DMT family transporter [unclassified Paludibacterium]|uniref:DMT family transporter n=1 Tax=unclassified Paludibacterium TaxID=2618429 RepID=UPI00207B3948|nr:DMT family transporter [Paludibacterium sp. B53371]BEV70816.1 DMT family transporter [Paludibacterium sp. THUN1379]
MQQLTRGVACGMAAGALWGTVFMAPLWASDFTPLQLSAGRYLAYGVVAAGLLLPRWRSVVPGLGWREWLVLAWLSLLGNILYYLLLASAVQRGGVAMTSLMIGFMPVAIALIGYYRQRKPPLFRLLPSLLLGLAGVLCIVWPSLHSARQAAGNHPLTGLLCAVGALVSWTWFAVSNSHSLSRLQHISAGDWSLLLGVVTGIESLLLIVPSLQDSTAHGASDWLRFAAVSAGIALFASVIGNAFWNRMSRLLPLTMTGQMILFETLFALLYSFLWAWRGPTLWETLAAFLLMISVLLSVSSHRH